MDILEKALHLAGLGFHIFPVVKDTKLPAIKDFPNRATRDPHKIKAFFSDSLGLPRDYNIGIYTGKFSEDEMLVAIDIDVAKGKKGLDSLLKLELEGFSFPETFQQKTPSGGIHYVYRTKRSERIRSGVNVLGPNIDIRAEGAFIVGAGSSTESGVYTTNSIAPQIAPQWILGRLQRKRESHDDRIVDTKSINSVQASERAKYYLENAAAVGIEGEGGDTTTYKVAARVKDFGASASECLQLMLDYWNDRCEPPWSPDALKTKVDHAYRYGERPIGDDAPETQFDEVESSDDKSFLETINNNHAIVYIGGSHAILFDTKDEKGRPETKYLSEATFKRKYSNKLVQYGKKSVTWSDAWMSWEKRKEYRGLVFAPERPFKDGYFNLWRGFSCAPVKFAEANKDAQKGFSMFKDFAKEVVCNGDADLFTWLMCYCAHLVQKPYERPLTTLVFRGSKGVGKNAFVDRVGRLLGPRHYLVAHNPRYLTSNFNGHLDSCLCLVLDEAFWSGDKQAEGVLKGYTTAPEIMIERKGEEPYTVDNLARIIVIGNEKWLVPASADERRYAVFNINELRKQDTTYFTELRYLMDFGGGANVLLQYLKDFDIRSANINIAPKTVGLLEQKLASSEPFEKWWFDCLTEERIVGDDFEEEWPEELNRDRFRSAFRKYIKERNMGRWIPDDYSIGKLINKCLPTIGGGQKRTSEGKKYVYKFPKIEEARREWDKYIGHPVKWDISDIIN